MDERDLLARRFEEQRPRLLAVAHRMLGSWGDAEDAVQEAWLRLARTDSEAVANLAGWLTTVVGRVCLDALRARTSRPVVVPDPDAAADPVDPADPEAEAVQADAVGLALLVVLESLPPAERLAYVLHDVFAVPFDEIAAIVDRSPAAARQLASRGRRRVQDAGPVNDPTAARRRRLVDAFLAASRGGDFGALVALLDPQARVRADAAAVAMGAAGEDRGAEAVARTFAGRARAARAALLDGLPGAVWMQGGTLRVAFIMSTDAAATAITDIELVADPDRLAALDVELL